MQVHKALQNTATLAFLLYIIQENIILGSFTTYFFPKSIAMSIFQRDLCTALAVLLQKQSVSEVISKFII